MELNVNYLGEIITIIQFYFKNYITRYYLCCLLPDTVRSCFLISIHYVCDYFSCLFNARQPDVLLKTIKIYKYRQNTKKFDVILTVHRR